MTLPRCPECHEPLRDHIISNQQVNAAAWHKAFTGKVKPKGFHVGAQLFTQEVLVPARPSEMNLILPSKWYGKIVEIELANAAPAETG